MVEQKKYGIFRIEKVKLCDGGEAMGRLKHAFREFKNDSFDPELTEKNLLFQYGSAKEVMKAYKERVKSITTEKYKPSKNAVGLFTTVMTQAYHSGINVIIDDMTYSDLYNKCEEYQYIMVNIISDRLSKHQLS